MTTYDYITNLIMYFYRCTCSPLPIPSPHDQLRPGWGFSSYIHRRYQPVSPWIGSSNKKHQNNPEAILLNPQHPSLSHISREKTQMLSILDPRFSQQDVPWTDRLVRSLLPSAQDYAHARQEVLKVQLRCDVVVCPGRCRYLRGLNSPLPGFCGTISLGKNMLFVFFLISGSSIRWDWSKIPSCWEFHGMGWSYHAWAC